MRTLLASALVLLACGCADRSSSPSGADAPPTVPSGPDAVVLRIPRSGGTVAAYAYPGLDSVIWRSTQRAPALRRIIAFGPEDGYIAAVDTAGSPVRIDLRLGTVFRVRGGAVTSAASFDGGAIYALNADGELTRFTPSGGDWKVRSPLPASALLPQADGSLIVAGAQDNRLLVWRVRPPNDSLSDSVSLDLGEDAMLAETISTTAGTVGDRVYLGGGEHVLAINTRDLSTPLNVEVGDPVQSLVYTPSGDRVFAAIRDEPVLRIVDRFEEGVSGRVRLPGPAQELRMDPLGRTLLVRGAGDTTWVVSVADARVQGTLGGEWRSDLPMVLADGRIAVARGADVMLVNGSSLQDDAKVTGGARDLWYAIRWNGFRPRAAGLDAPVEFRNSAPRPVDTMPSSESSTIAPPQDSVGTPPPLRPTRVTPPRAPRQELFTVSFAALLNERQARDLAKKIRVEGSSPRVVTSERDGRTIYRVVLGPYTSRGEAERIGRISGYNYWVYEGTP